MQHTGLSLSVIIGVLTVTVLASLLSKRGRAQNAVATARRHATAYLDAEYTTDPAEQDRIFHALRDCHVLGRSREEDRSAHRHRTAQVTRRR